MLTTKEAAERLGLTASAIDKRAKKLGIAKQRQGKFALISEEDFEKIADYEGAIGSYQTTSNHTQPGITPHPTTSNQEELSLLRSQLVEKDSQIKELHQLLSQEQQLSASRQQEINQLRNNVKLLEDHRSPEIDSMVAMLEQTRDSFLQNMKILNRDQETLTPSPYS